MNQGRFLPRTAQVLALSIAALVAVDAHAQSTSRQRRGAQPTDGPNAIGETDAAAMELVDSLLAPFAPEDPLPNVISRALGGKPAKSRRATWSARLARNPYPDDGNPPFVLIDRYGGIQRFVEPVEAIDLAKYVGQTVAVRRDTGGTLLASQLDLPRTPVRRAVRGAAPSGVQQAALQEPLPALTPEPADGAVMPSADAPPTPFGEAIEGEIVDEGPFLHEGEMMMSDGGEMMYEGGRMVVPDGVDPLYLDGDSELGHCTVCGDGVCGGSGCLDGCGFGSRPVINVRVEYLLWWFDGMNVPPLVVASDDSIFELEDPVVFGGHDGVLDGSRDGARTTIGYWLDDYGRLAIEGDYFAFGKEDARFSAGDGPSPTQNAPFFIGRPFFQTFPLDGNDDGDFLDPEDSFPGPAVEDVDTQNISGSVGIVVESEFQSAGLHLRRNLCCVSGCVAGCGDCVSCGSSVGCSSGVGCGMCDGANPTCPFCPLLGTALGRFFRGGTRHVDMIYGVRWAQLEERIGITENLLGLPGSVDAGTSFNINESFDVDNEFFGGEIGFIVDWQRRRWSLELLSKLAIGNTRQRANLAGLTTTTDPTEQYPNSALLVQPSNVGSYEQNEFSVIPQIGLTGGYLLTERMRFTLGYTLLYWTRVARPGDLISLDVDPRQIPPADGAGLDLAIVRPQFVFRDTDIWAHGFNAGLDYRW